MAGSRASKTARVRAIVQCCGALRWLRRNAMLRCDALAAAATRALRCCDALASIRKPDDFGRLGFGTSLPSILASVRRTMGSLPSLALACVLFCNVAAAPEPRAMGSLTGLALAGIVVCAALPEPLAEPPRAAALRRCGDLPGCDVDAVERNLAVMAAPCDLAEVARLARGPRRHAAKERAARDGW